MCVDYRAVNKKTIKDKYPPSRIDDLRDNLKGRKFYTTLDLASGYHQIPGDEESVPKTAFVTPDSHYKYLKLPFGLVAYLDDVLIPSKIAEEELKHMESVLKLFDSAGMTLRLMLFSSYQN